MPWSAARWISAITSAENAAERRSGGGRSPETLSASSVGGGMVDMEMVELARRAVMPETRRVGRDAGACQQRGDPRDQIRGHRLLDAIGAQAGDRAGDE